MRQVDRIFNSMVGKGETAPYRYYDYLESDGKGRYIDTGVCVGGQWSIEIDYIWLSQNVGNTTIWLCGVRQGTPPASPAYWLRSSNSKLLSVYNLGSTNYESPYITPQHGYSYQRHKNVITIYDGDSVFYTVTPTLSAITSAYTHYLFTVNQAGTFQPSYPASKRLGCVRIYDDSDVIVRDFRPAVRNADGVAGMHDVVNDVFYTNANPAGDNFLYGNLT